MPKLLVLFEMVLFVIFICERMVCVSGGVKGRAHIDTTDCSTPRIPCLIQLFFWQQTELGGHLFQCASSHCPLLPLYLHSDKNNGLYFICLPGVSVNMILG